MELRAAGPKREGYLIIQVCVCVHVCVRARVCECRGEWMYSMFLTTGIINCSVSLKKLVQLTHFVVSN